MQLALMKFIIINTFMGTAFLLISFFMIMDHLQIAQSQKQNITDLFEWIPFVSDQNLNIKNISPDYYQNFFMNGSTGNQNGGYTAYHSFNAESLVLTTGIIEKMNLENPNINSQFTISFKIIGKSDNYSLTLVNGRVPEPGWNEGTYYSAIDHNNTLVIDFKELISSVGDNYVGVEKITLGLEKNTDVPGIMFGIYPVDNKIPPQILNRSAVK